MKKNILVIHPRCCIRAIKQIEGLLHKNIYNISLITYEKKYLPNIPQKIRNKIKILNFKFRNRFLKRFLFKRFLKTIAFDYDIIHCHNEPNYYIIDVMSVIKNKIPIIYDIHDFTSMRSGIENKNEAFIWDSKKKNLKPMI